MLERDTIKHPIERDIITYLTDHEYARFSDMRTSKIDTNLFTYHLKLLVKSGYITKTEDGYTLSHLGLDYISRRNSEPSLLHLQPKLATALVIQDGYGKVLLQKRITQPYINVWELPSFEMRVDDESILIAAQKHINEAFSCGPLGLRHAGDCYVTVGKRIRTNVHPAEGGVFIDGDTLHLATREVFELESRTFRHVIRFESDDLVVGDQYMWVEPLGIAEIKTAPGTEQIITRAFFGDVFFFEEFVVER